MQHNQSYSDLQAKEYKQKCGAVKKETRKAVIEYERRIVNDKKSSKRLYGYARG
jgi:hypothetical protein